jgi:hypothetical protein
VNWHLLDSGANTSADGSLGLARKPHPASRSRRCCGSLSARQPRQPSGGLQG